MVNKIMYQKIQHFKRKGFTKADIVRETVLKKKSKAFRSNSCCFSI